MLAAGFNLLEVLGVCMHLVLGLVLLIGGFVVYQVWKFKRAVNQVGAAMQQAVQQMQNVSKPVFIDVEGQVVDPSAVQDELRERESKVQTPIGSLLIDHTRHDAELKMADVFRDAFIAQSGWTEEKWSELGEHVLFVYEKMEPTEIVLWFVNHTHTPLGEDRSADLRAAVSSLGARLAMQLLIAGDPSLDAHRVAVLESQGADVYLATEGNPPP